MSNIEKWDPEDSHFWTSKGKKIANRNLLISIPCLLCGFAIWIYWGIITVQMINLDFPIPKEQLFTLTAIAGLTGATLRIPSTFFIRLAGGRNTVFFTTALLLLPCIGTGIALQNRDTSLLTFQILALLSGLGGGNFASSMSNISFFFPKKTQGLSLGLNAGLGNIGVTTMQILIPLIMTVSVFGGEGTILKISSGTLFGKIPPGTITYIHNAGFVWVFILVPIVIAAWFGMNNILTEHISPKIGSPINAFSKITGMLLIGFFTSIFGLWLMLGKAANGSGLNISKWLILPSVIILTVFLLKQIPGTIKQSLNRQYKIFNNKHTWAMTIIYTMTFGSFIGYSAALPLTIKVVFGFTHIMGPDNVLSHNIANTNGPSALMYAWMGPFIGALIRPLGGLISDKLGGAKVTQIISFIMVFSALGVAYFIKKAYCSPTPEDYFIPFLILFLILFASTGIGNGSTFRTIAVVFNKEQAGPVLGWTSAVAAYGAFIIPMVFGEQVAATTPEYAIYGFAIFYILCIIINWWFYLRKNAYFNNP